MEVFKVDNDKVLIDFSSMKNVNEVLENIDFQNIELYDFIEKDNVFQVADYRELTEKEKQYLPKRLSENVLVFRGSNKTVFIQYYPLEYGSSYFTGFDKGYNIIQEEKEE